MAMKPQQINSVSVDTLRYNQYFTTTGDITECSKSLHSYQKTGGDPNSTVAKIPADAVIIGWAKEKLGMA